MNFLMDIGWYIVPFVCVLSILVFVHELGHYLVARYNGVGVDVFSIGFGPEIFGWTDKAGTRWKISWLPLGGYVKMVGDADPASTPDLEALQKMDGDQKSRSLFYKTVWQRIAVSAAGPIANYLFAILIFSILFATVGQRYTLPIVKIVTEGSAAAIAGIQEGDRIIALNEVPIDSYEQVLKMVSAHPDEPLIILLEKKTGERRVVAATPKLDSLTDYFGTVHKRGLLGIKPSGEVEYKSHSWGSACIYGTKEVFLQSAETLKMLGGIIIGAKPADGLGGPVRIAQMSGEIAQSGMASLIWFMGVLSVSLGLINFFPIPMLDGGHLIFYFIEVLRGRPLSDKAQEFGFRIGFGLVAGLLLLVTCNDLLRIFFK